MTWTAPAGHVGPRPRDSYRGARRNLHYRRNAEGNLHNPEHRRAVPFFIGDTGFWYRRFDVPVKPLKVFPTFTARELAWSSRSRI